MAQTVKNLPATQKTWVRSLDLEDPLEEGMETHFSILAWRIPMDREAWWATVHGVPKSRTRLKRLSRHISSMYIRGRGFQRHLKQSRIYWGYELVVGEQSPFTLLTSKTLLKKCLRKKHTQETRLCPRPHGKSLNVSQAEFPSGKSKAQVESDFSQRSLTLIKWRPQIPPPYKGFLGGGRTARLLRA